MPSISVKASVEDTAEGLAVMDAEDQERALAAIVRGPGGCLLSVYRSSTRGGPQVSWVGPDGTYFKMYHWRVVLWLTQGRIPAPRTSRRLCQNERCVNPEHRS